MAAVENIEWLNQNLLRAYPVREDADVTPRLSDGTVAAGLSLPTCLLSDFSFTVPFDMASASVPCLTGVSHTGDGFSIEISLGGSVLATHTVKVSSHTVNRAYRLVGAGEYADCGGWIVFGDLRRAAEDLPEGVYHFQHDQVPFEVSTLRMAPRGVRSISAVGRYGLKTSAPLFGNVRLIAGSDMSIRADSDGNSIWLDAESGTGYERTDPCKCGSTDERRVRSINGMPVANVVIVGEQPCMSVKTQTDPPAVLISDKCSTPCCGCSELNFVESAVSTVNRSISVLNGYAEKLRQRLEELNTNLIETKASFAAHPNP